MIQIATLTKAINDGLNANTLGLTFSIKSEVGRRREPKRDGNTITNYINGVARIVQADVIPTQDIIVATQTVRLEIRLPLPDDAPPDAVIAPVRQVLADYFEASKLQVLPDESGKRFTVSSYASLPSTGEVALMAGDGLSVTFVCTIYYNFIENGVSSLNCSMTFDGAPVPYTDATISRVPVMESNPYSDYGGISEAVTTSTALNVEFNAPTLNDGHALFAAFKAYVTTGKPTVHTLALNYDGDETQYTVTFGNVGMALEGVKNGMSKISLVEVRGFNNGE